MKDDVFTEETQTATPDYETERNKPMPNRIHGKIQHKLGFQLELNYGDQFDFSDEVTLDSTPSSTPDICIFPRKEQDLDWKTITAKEKEVPITTIEIVSPSQSIDEMAQKVWNIYFPLGVKSAWIVMPPPFKAIYVLTPDDNKQFFDTGILADPATGIQLEIEKVFEGLK